MGINGDPVVIKVDGSDPLPVTVDGAVTIAEPVTVDGTVAVSSVGGTVAVSSVADPVTIAIRTDIDAGNSNDGTLGAGLTWTGTWANLDGLAQVFFNVKSDQAGTYTMQFSSDGITADRTLGPYDLSAGGNAAQPLAAVRGYFRGTFTNTSGSTANLRIETRLLATATPLYVRLSDEFTNASSATATHAVIAGAQANGLVYNNVGISERDALRVELAGPLGGMGGAYTVSLTPRVQVVAVYGRALAGPARPPPARPAAAPHPPARPRLTLRTCPSAHVEVGELLPQLLERVAHPALHRVLGRADDVADLLERQPAHLSHQEHLALVVGQPRDRLRHARADLRRGGGLVGRHLVGRDGLDHRRAVLLGPAARRVKIADLKGPRRHQGISRPRMIAMYLCRQLTGASFPEIGLRFGGKDHSTVINACKRIESLQAEDSELRATVDALRGLLARESGTPALA